MSHKRFTQEVPMKFFKQLGHHALFSDNRDVISVIWVGNKWRAVCMNPDSARVYVSVWHDGYGKFYPTIYATLFETFRIRAHEPIIKYTLHRFPLCGLELLRLKCASM